jgi:low affinity Fe/Cu permease
MDPLTPLVTQPLALAAAVCGIAICLAALAPFDGAKQFARNVAIAVLVLFMLVFAGATVGVVVRDFLLEVQ